MTSPGRLVKGDRCWIQTMDGERYLMVAENGEVRTNPTTLEPNGIPERVVLWRVFDTSIVIDEGLEIGGEKPRVIPNTGMSAGRHDWKPGDDHNYRIDVTETGLLVTPMARPYIELTEEGAIYMAEMLMRFARLGAKRKERIKNEG